VFVSQLQPCIDDVQQSCEVAIYHKNTHVDLKWDLLHKLRPFIKARLWINYVCCFGSMLLVQASDGQQLVFGGQTQTVYGRPLLSFIAFRCHHELNEP